MRYTKTIFAVLSTTVAFSAHAQFGSIFQNVVESAAKQAVQQGTQQGIQQGVTQAVVGATAQPVAQTGPTLVNGCYFNLPAPPPGVVLNPDSNGNGCVDQSEANTYTYAVQAAYNAAQARGMAAPANNSALGSVVGSAMAVKNAGGTGNAAAWVAGQNALGAAANAARAQPVQAQVIAANPVDLNGDGIVTAEEVAAHQSRIAAANGMVAQAPVQNAQGAVSNATSEVVSGAVSGALKGLFGH